MDYLSDSDLWLILFNHFWQGGLSNELESKSDLSWQALFRSASFQRPSSLLSSSTSSPDQNDNPLPENHQVLLPQGSASENLEHELNTVSCDTHVSSKFQFTLSSELMFCREFLDLFRCYFFQCSK